MVVLFALARVVVGLSLAEVDAPVLAIAAAINAALTIPDLVVWNSVFARLGSLVSVVQCEVAGCSRLHLRCCQEDVIYVLSLPALYHGAPYYPAAAS
jgi:hypothetical protein